MTARGRVAHLVRALLATLLALALTAPVVSQVRAPIGAAPLSDVAPVA